jgi:hypothetical protein
MTIKYKDKTIQLTNREVWVLFYWMSGVSEDIRSSGEMDDKVSAAESLEDKIESLEKGN